MSFIRVMVGVGIFSLVCLMNKPLLLAASRNILVEELENAKKLATEIKSAKKLTTEVNNPLKRGQKDSSSANQFLEDILEDTEKRIKSLEFRKFILNQTASTRTFTVYAATQESAEKHLEFAEQALRDYLVSFPTFSFSPSTPVQILLYPNYMKYLQYDGLDAQILGHAISNRQKSVYLVKRNNAYILEQTVVSSNKYHRLATYEQENPYVFIHEVCHLFTFEMVNPSGYDLNELKPNLFLNEGLSEFFATRHNPDGFKKRIYLLFENRDARGYVTPSLPLPNITDFLKTNSYPKNESIATFYSEATLFARWLMELPSAPGLTSGPQLVKLFLNSAPDQMEGILRTYQRNNNFPEEGFSAYLTYRKKLFQQLNEPTPTSPDKIPVIRK